MKNRFLSALLEFPSKIPIYAIIAALTGFLMLVFPLELLPLVLRISGILVVVYAIFRTVTVFLSHGGLFSTGITIFALIGIMLLGFTLALTPNESSEILATLVGTYLLIDGAIGLIKLLLQRSSSYLSSVFAERMPRGKIIFLAILSSLMILAGVLLTVIRISDSRLGEVLCAVALIYASLERIFFALSEYKTRKKREISKEKDMYIEADFVDKTDTDN